MTEDEIRSRWSASVRNYGSEHTHDFTCSTWRGQNWPGSCDCSLRTPKTQENR